MGFPFFGQELRKIEQQLADVVGENEGESNSVIFDMSRKLESIARLSRYTTPNNSLLLRDTEVKADTLASGRPQRTDRFRAIVQEQRVLYADDDGSTRTLMRQVLRTIGVREFDMAANGEELIDKLDTFRPTIVITDWYMEPINGVEFLRRLRGGETPAAPDLLVVFLTSEQNISFVESAVSEGVDHFLAKPFSIGLVERAIYQSVMRKKHGGLLVNA